MSIDGRLRELFGVYAGLILISLKRLYKDGFVLRTVEAIRYNLSEALRENCNTLQFLFQTHLFS